MELNEQIDASANLVRDKIGVPLIYLKSGWEIWLETQIRNLRQQAKMLRQSKKAGIYWDEKRKATHLKQMIQFEENN